MISSEFSVINHLFIFFLSSSNTLRLWYPQLAAMIGNHVDESLCSAIAPDATPPLPADWEGEGEPCQPIDTDMVTYLQSVIVGSGSILTYGIGGMLGMLREA